jgi:ABC-type sugar transport system ATPase subunit
MPVRERNVAMVYQQFINYPSMTVFDNIASPLKLRGGSTAPHRSPGCGRWPPSCTSSPFSTACRPSCRAGSSSGWRWPVRWPRKRR